MKVIRLMECHKFASDVFYQIFKVKDPTLVLGLSATFKRLDGKHELLAKFCPVCDVIEIKEAIENKWLSSYKEYKVLLEVDNISEYNLLNLEFYNSFSFFSFNFEIAMKCLTNIIYRRQYAKQMNISATEMDAIVFSWNRALKGRKSFIMNHPKKVEITRRILKARQNKKAVTFSSTIKQAESIKIGNVVHSGKTKKKNAITLQDFSRLEYGVLNSAKSLDEGVDIKGLNLAIILCNTSSHQQKTQRVGRVIRYEENKEAEIFTLVIKGTVEENWFSTSSAGKSYLEITETELNDILDYQEIDSCEQIAKESNLLFRL